jgi:hypothetical protein
MAKLGLNAILYSGPANATPPTSAYANDTGGKMLNVQDLTYSDERNEADISTRGSVFELAVATNRKFSLSFTMVADEANLEYADIQEFYLANTPRAFKCISATGGTGIDADFYIMKLSHKEELKGVLIAEVELKPTYQAVGAGTARYPTAV